MAGMRKLSKAEEDALAQQYEHWVKDAKLHGRPVSVVAKVAFHAGYTAALADHVPTTGGETE